MTSGSASAIEEHQIVRSEVATRLLSVPGSAPAVVLLHGFSDSADTFRPVLELLADAGVAGMAVDLPGFGRAGAPPDRDHAFAFYDRFVRDVVRTAAAESGAPIVLGGNSLGGTLVMRAGSRSSDLKAIVPMAPAGPHLVPWLQRTGRVVASRLVSTPRLDTMQLPPRTTEFLLRTAYQRLCWGAGQDPSDEAVEYYLSHNRDMEVVRGRLGIAARMYPEMLNAWDPGAIRVPVHLVWGQDDRLVRAHGAQELAVALADVRWTVLPGVGHLPQLQASREVVDVLCAMRAA